MAFKYLLTSNKHSKKSLIAFHKSKNDFNQYHYIATKKKWQALTLTISESGGMMVSDSIKNVTSDLDRSLRLTIFLDIEHSNKYLSTWEKYSQNSIVEFVQFIVSTISLMRLGQHRLCQVFNFNFKYLLTPWHYSLSSDSFCWEIQWQDA